MKQICLIVFLKLKGSVVINTTVVKKERNKTINKNGIKWQKIPTLTRVNFANP